MIRNLFIAIAFNRVKLLDKKGRLERLSKSFKRNSVKIILFGSKGYRAIILTFTQNYTLGKSH